ncbi:MAG: putative zinc-binding metallopeptidase [Myxococcales bacterium]|nr:putative zinc-binding metallopeptidase [Myxococcales bacterium]
MPNSSRRKRRARVDWEGLPRRELLELRLCDLGVSIEGSWLEERVERVKHELRLRGLRLNPHFWLSDEWFSPADVPGVALPFYLAHPRLIRLERSQMLDVEGGTQESCLRLLRHELGHALQHAFQLQRRRSWRQHFGNPSTPYPQAYRPNPASRRYVHNLDAWYAQAHPEEDFAETFAVWLRPRYDWRKRYAGWPARRKLEYVDGLMATLVDQPRRVNSRARPYALPSLRITLREYYERKRAHYSVGYSNAYDRDLRRLFVDGSDDGQPASNTNGEPAATFLRRNRRRIRQLVARWTGEYEFALNQVLGEMVGRCKELGLRAVGGEHELLLEFAVLLTVHGVSYVYRGRDWHAM